MLEPQWLLLLMHITSFLCDNCVPLQILPSCYFGLHTILSSDPVWADLHSSSQSAAGRFDRHGPGEDRRQGVLLPTHANQRFFQF